MIILISDKYMDLMVPSMEVEFLRRLRGKQVVKLVRYSWWPASEVAAQCGIEDRLAFSLTAGPLAIYFEGGIILGLSSDPSLNSVIVWDEGARAASQDPNSLGRDEELFAISESGSFSTVFWKQLIGCCVIDVTILKRGQMNAKELQRPSEVGLRFNLSGGRSFIVSHGLHANSDDFSVLEESQFNSVELGEVSII
ncbi:hypothetical protein LOY69_07815 [Pseudomonas sp. B21-059]|uniref:hypothetical protein n=1 Tax=Pseudomonas sp. B21-059 TaxID=2895496 RepID=UPI0022340964|nr:hypothetical protein [Pseudomonas sp. B21-059]UZE36397.1 hypothetical protein LOY69_07815 [Pseudomonas sp. B21-059]